MDTSPGEAGDRTGIWVVYHPHYISDLLHQLGWSVQKPDSRAMERDEALIRAWLRRDWPRIKKARRIGEEIVVEDEFGMSYTEPVSFTCCGRISLFFELTGFPNSPLRFTPELAGLYEFH